MGSAATVVSAGTSRKARIASIFQHYYPEVRSKIIPQILFFIFSNSTQTNYKNLFQGRLGHCPPLLRGARPAAGARLRAQLRGARRQGDQEVQGLLGRSR